MKLRKVLSLLVAFAMILTASAAFAYTDVAVDSDAYEAVTGLSALNILTGYEDGTFAPEGKVKRSEMAAIIMRALGVNTSIQTNTIFSDVTAAHWASGAIAEAFGAGVINGRSLQYAADGVTVVGGTFDPDAEVSYDEAVKMIVAAMGYGLKAESMVKPGVNPFPTAYNLIADQKGITDGVEKTVGGASRATIAKLVWNALPVNLMEQTAYGSQEEFKEVDDKSLLLTKQRAVLVEAKIGALSLDPADTEITLVDPELDDVAEYKYDESVFATLDKGACDFAGLQGLKVKVLVDVKDKNDPVVIAAFPSSANKTLTVNAKLFVGIDEDDDVIRYYKSLDSTTVNKSSKVNDTVTVYKNLEVCGDTFAEIAENGDYDVLRFVDTDNDGYYDTLFVDDYASFVVSDADAESYTILADNDAYNTGVETEIVLDPEDEEVSWKMADENGKELTIADVAVGDVITYAKSEIDGFAYWDITVCKSSAVTGTVDQVKEVKNRAKGVSVYAYTVDGKDYMLNWTETTDGDAALKVGEAGTFQITADGKIINVKIDEAVRNFGVVLAVKLNDSAWSTDVQAMLLKADGTVETVSFADKVTLNNDETKTEEDDLDADAIDTAVVAAGRVVMYELNAEGEIKALAYGAGIKAKDDDYKVAELDGAYAESSAKLDGQYLVEGSVVVALKGAVDDDASDEYDAADKKNYSLITTSSLVDGDEYTGYAVVDENKEVVLVVVEDFVVNPAFDGAAMYVTGKSTVAVDGESRTKLFGVIGNEAVEYVLAEDTKVVAMGEVAELATLSAKALVEGDVIQFTVNGAGEIDSYRPVVKMDGTKAKFLAIADKAELNKEDNATDDAVAVALYAVETEADEEFVLTKDVIEAFIDVDDDYVLNDGFGVAGFVNKVNNNNVGLFFYQTDDGETEKDWASNNYVDVAGDASVYAFVNSDAYGSGYEVKSISSLQTFAQRGSVLSRTDDILYIFKYDDEVVVNYVIDVKGNNK